MLYIIPAEHVRNFTQLVRIYSAKFFVSVFVRHGVVICTLVTVFELVRWIVFWKYCKFWISLSCFKDNVKLFSFVNRAFYVKRFNVVVGMTWQKDQTKISWIFYGVSKLNYDKYFSVYKKTIFIYVF